ncbi:MAG: neutral/alkaline non-lysosomal ceramidase N-terminal domain-containing protein [Limnochordia bacterium]
MGILHAGAAEVDITPALGSYLAGSFNERKARDISDPLRAKALVIDDGDKQVAMIILDLLAIERSEVQKMRTLIEEATGIPPENVLIACTHTHTGPITYLSHRRRDEAYLSWLVRRVSDCVQLALKRLRPARLAWGQGEVYGISFCRRYRMSDGTVQMNPGRGNPNVVEPASPIDPAVGVLLVEDENGAPIAVVAQFSLHYVGTDDSLAVSADYYAHFDRFMRRMLGSSCLPMLFNGTSGQINNINVFSKHQEKGHRQAARVASILGGEVLKVLSRIKPGDDISLAAASVDVKLPRREITPEDLKLAKAIIAGDDPDPEANQFSFVVGQPILDSRRLHYANRCLRLKDLPAHIVAEVQTLRIGGSAWVGLPGEIFVEMGLAIKKNSPCADTFVIGLANDNVGYVPTDHAFAHEGGYETWPGGWKPIGPGTEGILVSTAQRLLNELCAR